MKRTRLTASLALTAACGLALAAGCAAGHGKSTSAHLSGAKEKMNAMKSATEFDMARQAYLAGDLDRALSRVEYSIELNPQVAKSHVLRGRILLEMGAMEQALDALVLAETLDVNSVEAHYYQGIIYERLLDREKALAAYKRSAAMEPGNAQYAIAVAEVLVDLGRVAEADEFLSGRGSAFEHNPGVKQTRGHLSMMLERPEDAVELFSEASLLAPEDQAIIEDLVRAQIATGRIAEAEYRLALLLEDEDNAERRDLKHLRARCLVATDRPVEARSILTGLTDGAAGANDAEAWAALGQVSYRLKDLKGVRRAAARLQAVAPHRHEGYLLQAMFERANGRHAAAIRATTASLQRNPRDLSSITLRGLSLYTLGKYEHAKKAFEYAQKLHPESAMLTRAVAAVDLKIAAQSGENAFASVPVPTE
ncbi:MAG: tetratricopeptide repeat protein [Planctomycetota bacterium]